MDLRAAANLNQGNTPVNTGLPDDEITITDPAHPLFGQTLKLVFCTVAPQHADRCLVEVFPHYTAWIPLRCTERAAEPGPQPTVLTAQAIAELVATFQAI